jgi:hypothetical protein
MSSKTGGHDGFGLLFRFFVAFLVFLHISGLFLLRFGNFLL